MATHSKWYVFAGLALVATAAYAAEREQAFYIGPSGLDSNPGTEAAPFATLLRARDAIREWRQTAEQKGRPVTVNIRGGRYRVTGTLTLTAEDSGTQESPVIWQAAPGEEVRLAGGVQLTGWEPVTAPAILERLTPEARGEVLQVNLGAIGVDSYGTVKPGPTRAEVFSDNQYMTLARYPNEGWERIAAIPEGAATKRPIGDPGRPDLNRYEGPFIYSGDRPERWRPSDDIWVHGYWFHDWSDQYHRVLKLDSAAKAIWPEPPYHSYGYKAGQRYYFLNILEELDQPGEWYLDRKTGLLYFWPPGPLDVAQVTFPELEQPMILLDNACHVHIRGITFECSRAGAVVIKGGSDNEIAGCVVRNVGGTAIDVDGGARHTVRSCDVYEVATTGIAVNGGDRKTLARGDHLVENCHIHDFARIEKTYRPGISLQGVGNRVSHCLIHDCPHEGIGYGGNDHVIEYCEFTRIATETGDVGVMYTAMDWASMGHEFRYNYFHRIHAPGKLGCFTVYPDLPCGGIYLHGNVFYDVDLVFLTNSGRGMTIENNLFVRARNGIRFNVWMDMKKFQEGGNWRMVERLQEVNYDQPPYSTRYPALARLAEDFAKGEEEVLQRALPKDNIVRRNVSWGDGYFLWLGPQADFSHVKVEQNLICDPVVFIGSLTGDGNSRTFNNGDEEIRAVLEQSGNVIASGNPGL
ncbi:MAG: hypothetical protein GWP08_18685, partial [Nitrospiraceae bacterium]|nr:hypothetical protein [Nitrospiraceae bacterium]